MAIYSGFSHEKWWFSIVMLNYQRVNVTDETTMDIDDDRADRGNSLSIWKPRQLVQVQSGLSLAAGPSAFE